MPSFSLLSLNTFGVPFYPSTWRIKRLAAELSRLAPSIICLQEIQQNAYLSTLQSGLKAYPTQTFFPNRFAPKGGLFTASIAGCPIVESEFIPFPHRGAMLSIGFADWELHKGVLLADLEIVGRRVIVMNTHLQANYFSDWRPSNSQTRIQIEQVKTLAEIARAQPEDAWVFVCGDFNFPPQSPAYEAMLAHSGLINALAGDPRPTYKPFPLVSSKWLIPLDYCFYRIPVGQVGRVAADILPIVNSQARWPYQRFLTDHHALILNIG
jgi:endonuclease/exonuclease/phosphatase family metal-dependent hydrolase